MPGFSIPRLVSGGLITNYNCTSRCRHCLYNCSPSRSGDYIRPDTALELFTAARRAGARTMHIGGGEPMLAPEKLGDVLASARIAGTPIEYVETNSSWFTSHQAACGILEQLKGKGLVMLLVSISPFHMEYIAFSKVQGVIRACRETGIRTFLWMETFLRDLLEFDPGKPHRFEEVLERMGPEYLRSIRQRYWVHEGGRALDVFRTLSRAKTLDQVLDEADLSCRETLGDTSHFHLDLYGNYIPGLCAGFGIDYRDIMYPLDQRKYPLLAALFEKGIRGLVELAEKAHAFEDHQKRYSGKCDVCNSVRRFIVAKGCPYRELAPHGFYHN